MNAKSRSWGDGGSVWKVLAVQAEDQGLIPRSYIKKGNLSPKPQTSVWWYMLAVPALGGQTQVRLHGLQSGEGPGE